MLWLFLALFGALFTSLTGILAKIGIKDVNSNFATFFRTAVVIVFSIILCSISGSISSISVLSKQNWLFLVLSGVATGCSWLCYYKAIKLGNINKVTPIDKSSFILSSVLFIIFFFEDTTNGGDLLTIIMLMLSIILMFSGTILMIGKNSNDKTSTKGWFIYAVLSAVFASIVSLFVKIGLKGCPSDLGTLIRTVIVCIFAFLIVLIRKDYRGTKNITNKSWLFLTLSAIATGGAWLCEYAALNIDNVNPVAVNSISKLSILLTMLFSFFILKEKFTKKSLLGLGLLVLGIILIIIFSL